MSHTFAVDETRHREVENRRHRLESDMRAAHVAPHIIERVLRLNADPVHGQLLRGIHYKDAAHSYRFARYLSKGRFIRRFGREAFERLPRQLLMKDGKRVYVTPAALRELGL